MSFGVVEMCDCKCKWRKRCRKPNALSNESCLIGIVTGANSGFLPSSLEPRVQIRRFCPRQVALEPDIISQCANIYKGRYR